MQTNYVKGPDAISISTIDHNQQKTWICLELRSHPDCWRQEEGCWLLELALSGSRQVCPARTLATWAAAHRKKEHEWGERQAQKRDGRRGAWKDEFPHDLTRTFVALKWAHSLGLLFPSFFLSLSSSSLFLLLLQFSYLYIFLEDATTCPFSPYLV